MAATRPRSFAKSMMASGLADKARPLAMAGHFVNPMNPAETPYFWHFGHQKVLRPPCMKRATSVPQTHGSPSRP